MNVDIANYILGKIDGLNWLDKYAGLVRPVTIHQPSNIDPNRTIKKVFPIACDVSEVDCVANNSMTDLIPDSRYKSLLYFEDGGIQVTGGDARYIHLRSTLKLVCWLNGDKLGYDGCGISSIALMTILQILCQLPKNQNSTPYVGIDIAPTAEEPKSAAIFSKYSYDEAQTQYLMYPYDYFALNIRTDFKLPYNCIADFTLLAEKVC